MSAKPVTYLYTILVGVRSNKALAAITYPDDNATSLARAQNDFKELGFTMQLSKVYEEQEALSLNSYKGRLFSCKVYTK